jgi:hypothetical protein
MPDPMDAGNEIKVSLEVLCTLDRLKIEAFTSLLADLISLIGTLSVSNLKKIFIVEDSQVATKVNTIIKDSGSTGSYSPSDIYPANAVAVPIDKGTELTCYIVIGKKNLDPIDKEHNHPVETVLTLLEELLHVWVYTSTWQRRGYVQYRKLNYSACEADLMTIASQMCDEYVVIRRKSVLASNLPLFEQEPYEGLVAGKLSYGGDIAVNLRNGVIDLEKIIIEASKHREVVSGAWTDLIRILYRGIFEPLSRYTAYVDGTSIESELNIELKSNNFFNDVISGFWVKIHNGLNRVFESKLDDTEVVLSEIVGILQELLKMIGVTYIVIENGICNVEYKSTFFDTYHHK